MRNKFVPLAVLTASLLGIAAAAHAQYTAIVSVAPPAPRVEVVPAQRPGHVWAPGHYEWRGGQYAWVEGHWLAARNGYEYREPRWVQRGNGEWMMVGGNWERGAYGDRDHDGIPNRYDADNRRFGPKGDMDHDGIPNARDHDRDGDGVRNRNDRYPDNPRRS
jgi:hypothetical protein